MLQTVRGTHDSLHRTCLKYRFIKDLIRSECFRYGYREISTPVFEFLEVFHEIGKTSEIFSREIYTFLDRGGRRLALRPEGTAPVVRALLSNHLMSSNFLPIRLLYEGPMFRYERPQKGRYRQFDQTGIEMFGSDSPSSDVEVISMAVHILSQLGIMKKIQLEVNSLGDQESRNSYSKQLLIYLRNYKKELSKTSREKLEKNPLRILDSKDKDDRKVLEKSPSYENFLTVKSKEFFSMVKEGLERLGIVFIYNPRLVRGLDYYTHTIFEFTSDQLGAKNTILAGGRYDNLVKKMGGPDTAAVGWATGIDRISLLQEIHKEERDGIFIIPSSQNLESEALNIAQLLRASKLLKKKFCIEIKSHNLLKKNFVLPNVFRTECVLILKEESLGEMSILVRTGKIREKEVIVSLNELEEYISTLI